MSESFDVSDDDVRVLSECADLPLDADRRALVAGTLNAWLPDAHQLSRLMSDPMFLPVVPITAVVHPAGRENGE